MRSIQVPLIAEEGAAAAALGDMCAKPGMTTQARQAK
jgi:hypothetical protein